MGKGGKGKASGAAKPKDDEDALLDAAIAQANAERASAPPAAAQLADKKKAGKKARGQAKSTPPDTVLSMAETLKKMDKVMTFTFSRLLPDGNKDVCPAPNGAITFYTDAADAKADLAELQAAQPEMNFTLDYTPLGRAFALTQGLMQLSLPGPSKLQFSRKIVQEVGEAGVPEELRKSRRA